MADEKSKKGAARQVFRDVVNESTTREKIQEMVDQALSLQTLTWAFCPNCKKKVQAEIPDLRGRVGVLVELLEQAEGKPAGDEAGVSVVVHRPAWPS